VLINVSVTTHPPGRAFIVANFIGAEFPKFVDRNRKPVDPAATAGGGCVVQPAAAVQKWPVLVRLASDAGWWTLVWNKVSALDQHLCELVEQRNKVAQQGS